MRRRTLFILVVSALAARVVGLNFDQTHFFHPDERAIGNAIFGLSFHPLQLNPHFFPYGSFPFYVTKVVTSVLSLARPWFGSYDGVILTGRFLSALWGTATVLLLALFGRRLYGEKTGLLAGFLLAGTVLHVQNSHFATNDIPLAFLALLAVVLLTRFAETGSRATLAAAGLVAGLAVATKVSAAPILLPVAVAGFLRFRTEKARGRLLAAWAVGFSAVLLGFALGEPYAFLDHRGFLHDVVEQSRMVRHAGLFPFTNQYIGVPNYLYELREVVLWGMGPLLGLAALWGTLRRIGAVRALGAGEWIGLSWVLPVFAITGSFDVKFPRYLLPLYPFLVLWGAAWLQGLAEKGTAGRLLRGVVAFGTLAYALAFLTIYTRPHSAVTASEWFYANVPPGSRVVTQDWDEGFPFPLPGQPADLYRIVTLPYYEPDGPEKTGRIVREIAQADYLVLQTKRIYGAVTRSEMKFPVTNRYFRLLFAGDLGYTLVKDVSSRPGLFGVTLPTELADESFSVYDHPKALVFRNTGRLDAAEIARRIETATPSRSLSRRDLLLARAGTVPGQVAGAPAAGDGGFPGGTRSSILATLLAAVLLQLLGLSAYALLRAVVPDQPGLYALSKVAGVLLFAYVPWLLVSIGAASFGRGILLAWAAAFVVAGWLARRVRPPATALWGERAVVELVAWGVFLLFVAVRALNPEITWGEKPMDFAFLNALYRTPTLPPPEPWLSGATLSYTYFGHYVVASLGKALAIHPGVMFNLGIGVFASLTAAAVLAAGAVLGGVRTGLVAVFLALFVGNVSGVREAITRRELDWHYFWATSRTVPDTVNEYPFWSFLFADLHAHLLVMPFTAAFVAVLLMWLARRREGLEPPTWTSRAALLALGGLFLGAVEVTSGWSTPTYVALTLFLLGLDGILAFRKSRLGLADAPGSRLPAFVLPAGVFLLLGPVLFRPFWRSFVPPPPNWGREVGPWARPWDFLNVWGLFLVLGVPFLFVVWRGVLLPPEGERLSAWRRAALAVAAAALLASLFRFAPLGPAASVRTFLVALFLLGFFLTLNPRTPDSLRLTLGLATFSFAILAGTEFVFVWDRMNTLFKFYLEAWFLFSLALAVVWRGLFSGTLAAPWRGAWRLLTGLAVLAALFTSATALRGVLTLNRVNGPRGTLDGTAYLATFAPSEGAAFEWLNRNVPGLPVLCEAYGPSYQEYSRVTMNTGLPIVLGWEYHVRQRGHSRGETLERAVAVETIYTSRDQAAVAAVLKRYGVAYVYVGPLERKTYAGANLLSFQEWTGLLAPVYRNQDVTIFAVKGAPRTAAALLAPAPVVTESVPVPGASVPPEKLRQAPPGVFGQPRGVAVDSEGNAYLCDFLSNRIQKLSPVLQPLLAWGSYGSAPGQFKDLCGVAVSGSGEVFVADTWNSRVQVFDAGGRYLREWASDFFAPRGIAVDALGSVFVSDTGNGRVVRFDAAGRKELQFGKRGSGNGELFEPNGLAVDVKGRVFVCDNGNARMAVFGRDGTFVRTFPVPGWAREAFSEPNVVVDEGGTLWVTVPLAHEVRAYSAEGRLLTTIHGTGPGAPAAGPAFDKPVGIALRPDGKLLVTDIENRLVILSRPR